MVGALGSKQSV